VVENLSFVALVKKLRPGYTPPSRAKLSENLLWDETAHVMWDNQRQLLHSMNLTVAVDGWTDITGKSIYAYTVITPTRRVFLVALKNFLSDKHTAAFLTVEIKKVIDEIGPQKVAVSVTDKCGQYEEVEEYNFVGIFKHPWSQVYATLH
jgi:hypothetical protein